MQFQELAINALFTFHSFSKEVWKKIDNEHCLLVMSGDCILDNEEIDEPFSMNQRVFLYEGGEKVQEMQRCDKFQPMALVKALREYMRETNSNTLLEERTAEGIRLGLAWAIAEIMEQAVAKGRFTA